MKRCQVCQELSMRLVPVADTDVMSDADFLLVCGECVKVYQQEHASSLFSSPIDFELLNRDRRVLRQAA